ncbi:TadE/TadG family type IV pilus assembly protein [Streptomyces sp. NPDC058256]|uniref:TadE/TadG family type IV pilus assembly protein n=1 Tax=Streptomyces sp. NPDC058256 TaxID=3346408 RepID=UPI0036E8A9AD
MSDDRGSTTAEMVFVLPLVLTVVLLLAQAALYLHADHIAQATAAHALSATRVQDGTVAEGQTEADRVLDQLGRGPLRSAHVTVDRGTELAEVRVDGTVSSVLPFLHLPVHARSIGPIERFRSSGGVTP